MSEDEANSIVVGIIRQFQRERDEDKRALQKLYDDTVEVVAGLRKDMTKTMTVIQLNELGHDKRHDDDDKDRVVKQAENAQRFTELRQDIRDMRLWLVIGLVMFLGGLIAVAVFK